MLLFGRAAANGSLPTNGDDPPLQLDFSKIRRN